MSDIKKTLQVVGLSEATVRKLHANGDKIKKKVFSVKLRSSDGATTLSLNSPEPLNGLNESDIIDIVLKNSQTKIDDFNAWKDKDTDEPAAK